MTSIVERGPNEKKLVEAKKYGTVVKNRWAGDGVTSAERGGGMVLCKCDWCGKPYNFRRAGPRICTPCWAARGKRV